MEADDPADHEMHHETYVVPESVSDTVAETREARGWVWAVRTTMVRTLEAPFGGYERVMAAYEVAVSPLDTAPLGYGVSSHHALRSRKRPSR